MSYYVYQLTDPRTNSPFYIGKGKGDRTQVHFLPSRKHENPRKWAKMVSIQNDGHEVLVERVREDLTEVEALDLEEELITRYGRLDLDDNGILTNRRKRGVERKEGWQSYKREPRKNKKPAWNKGLTKDDPRVAKYAENVSKAKTGVKFSDEHRANLAEAQRRRHSNKNPT
ncbi:hypothetical protein D3C87_1305000 [compost metagenome]